ncbi:MAG TPA: hypothetical protein VMV59_11150 [Candidatus Dormibacteraeota bacterium]|nr:hypothetical protein [Candidatus Dormibacteraeota bacterium]
MVSMGVSSGKNGARVGGLGVSYPSGTGLREAMRRGDGNYLW